jgi:acetate kinase
MKILVLNSGSSSIKFRLMESDTARVLARGLIERIGEENGRMRYLRGDDGESVREEPIEDHRKGLSMVLETLTDPGVGALKSLEEIEAIGHRVVHGGEEFSDSVLIDDEVIAGIEKCSPMAPLHNPHNLEGIRAAMKNLPGTPNVAVFDTAFHQTMPPVAYIYPLPWEYYEDKRIRRYGFHGPSHQYVAARAAEMMGRPPEELCIVTCHLGNGCSLTAVKNGRSIDTSLGYGTMCGVMMGTRCGDVDPAIIVELAKSHGMTPEEINRVIYKESGLLGISGVSRDMRDVEEAAESGNRRAALALDLFADKVRKYIGGYAVTMGALDAVVFTAGVGENGPEIREKICSGLEVLGASIDPERNLARGREEDITGPDSRVRVLVIPTNEELMIARETAGLVAR